MICSRSPSVTGRPRIKAGQPVRFETLLLWNLLPVWSQNQHWSDSHWSQQELFAWIKSQLWRWKILQKSQVWLSLLKSHLPLIFFKKTTQKISTANHTLILILLLSPLSTRVEGSFPLTSSHYTTAFQAADPVATPSLGIYITSQQAPCRSREGANLWGSKHKISNYSTEKTENCHPKCKLLFLLGKKKESLWVSKTPFLKMIPRWLTSLFCISGLLLLHTLQEP